MFSRPIVRNIVFGAISILLVFFIAEIGIRIVGVQPRVDNPFFLLVRVFEYPDYFKKDHDLFWRLRANIKEGTEFLVPGSYRTNSLGLRGDSYAVSDFAAASRIACFGNSCTFGWRMQENETYAQQLETLLNAQPDSKRFKVFNCGVPGYSTFQGLRMLREYLPILKPAVVSICYGWNDHWAAGFDIEDKNQKTSPQFVLDIQNLLSDSYLYRSAKYLLLAKYEKQKQYRFDRESPRYRVSLEDYSNNLREMVDYCRSNAAKPILITTPAGDIDPGMDNPMEQYHERYNEVVRRVARDLSVPLVDAAAEFRDHQEFYDNPRADFIHYNAKGAALIASRLAETILQGR